MSERYICPCGGDGFECDRCLIARLERERDEARAVAERAHAMTTVRPCQWDAEDAILFLNGVPWKWSDTTRDVVTKLRERQRGSKIEEGI